MQQRVAGLLLWARQAGDIGRSQQTPVAAAANAGSVTLTAE